MIPTSPKASKQKYLSVSIGNGWITTPVFVNRHVSSFWFPAKHYCLPINLVSGYLLGGNKLGGDNKTSDINACHRNDGNDHMRQRSWRRLPEKLATGSVLPYGQQLRHSSLPLGLLDQKQISNHASHQKADEPVFQGN
ncbi:hypothetical protein [Mesorhizobium sp. DCY119]|uniref:hypothetical protein n=1 Tax=Mesorhizobium sp. DCY119 TaxID=2108445 RepID=UPI0014034683|nr:hypothetical protein [Mesorhizobium sp. DCY119]